MKDNNAQKKEALKYLSAALNKSKDYSGLTITSELLEELYDAFLANTIVPDKDAVNAVDRILMKHSGGS